MAFTLIKHEVEQYDPDSDSLGCSCGDYSIGAEPSKRLTWATGNADEPYISVTETYYVEAWLLDAETGESKQLDATDLDELSDEERARVRYSVENQTEFLGHQELDDPGGTETRTDIEYEAGSALFYSSLENAEHEARRLARSMDPEHYSPENWRK